jgi:hypothetical protein
MITFKGYADSMDSVLPFVVGLLILGRSGFMLISGSASADSKGLLRNEEPLTYWLRRRRFRNRHRPLHFCVAELARRLAIG